MSKPDERPALEDVLDAYLATVEEPELDSAREWAERFPEYAKDIRDFVTSWRLAARLPPDPRAVPIDAATFVQQGMAVVMAVFRSEQEKDRAVFPPGPIESLYAEAQAHSITPVDLAARLDVSLPLVAKLNRRLIDPASIPRELIEAIAATLERVADAVRAYLVRTPTLATGAFHRAATKPAIAGRENFFAAVRADSALTDEQRARWLALAPRGKRSP